MQNQSSLESATVSGRVSSYINKDVASLFIFASSCAAVNPYKNIFGIKVVGLPEVVYGLIIFASGLMITMLSIYFGVKSDRHGSFAKIIVFCCCCGIIGNLAVFFWPVASVFLLANCILLPAFYCVNSLIYGLSAAKNKAVSEGERLKSNAYLRSAYSLAYVMTLGFIGLVALAKDELRYLWLYSAILAAGILCIFVFTRMAQQEIILKSSSYSLRSFFGLDNSLRILSVSLITNLLFTLDAAAPLFIVDGLKSGYSTIGVFEASIAMLEVVFIFVWLKLSYRHNIVHLILLGAFSFSVGLLLLTFTKSVTELYMVIPVLAVGASCLISLPISYFQSLAPERPGLGGSLIAVNFFLSSTISSLLYSFGFYLSDLQGYIWLSVVAAIVGTVVLAWRKTSLHR